MGDCGISGPKEAVAPPGACDAPSGRCPILPNPIGRKTVHSGRMEKSQMLEELKRNPKNVRFERLCKIAEAFGFRFRGGKGSHRVYVREGVKEILNFQDVSGKAKPYQVRQFVKIAEKYGLTEDG